MFPKFRGTAYHIIGNCAKSGTSAYVRKRDYLYIKPNPPLIQEKQYDRKGLISPTSSQQMIANKMTAHDFEKNKGKGPIVDAEISNVITFNTRKMPLFTQSSSMNIETLQNIDSLSFEKKFEFKLLICCDLYDFTDTNVDITNREQKTRILCELVQFFEQNNEAKNLSEHLQEETMKMIETNIVRPTPIIPMSPILLDFTTVFVEPAWPQLFYVYQVLNRLISLYPESKLFNLDFVKTIIHLTNIPDNNERLQLLAFLRVYYDTHQSQKTEILGLVRMKLIDVHDLDSPPFCVTPLLVFLSHIYQRCNKQPPMEFFTLIKTSVFPLVISSYLPLFHAHMLSLLNTIIAPGNYLANEFHKELIRYWPNSSGQKQCSFTEFLLFCMSKMNVQQVTDSIKITLMKLNNVIIGDQLHAAEIVLDYIIGSHKDPWVTNHSKRFVVTLYDAIKETSINKWSDTIREKANDALIELGKLDRKAFLKVRQGKQDELQKKRMEINKAASKNWQRIIVQIRDNSINNKEEIAKIKEAFQYKKAKKNM